MKELDELDLPEDLRYAENHEWAKSEADNLRIGISDYAQDQLGDMVFVELPRVGDTFAQKEQFGTVESVKAVSELYMPVAGEIISVNKTLEESPELVNKDPYGKGWMIEVKPSDLSELETMMTKGVYMEMLRGKK